MLTWLENFDGVNLWSWTTLASVVDIVIVAFFIYQLIKITKGTRATELLKGILFIIIIKFISSIFQLHTTEYIVNFIIQWSAIALIVIFQPELRRGLQHIGRGSLFSIRKKTNPVDETINEISEAVHYMSRRHIGALISIEMDSSLSEYIKTGIPLDALISSEIIINAFIPNTPLHDGAMILKNFKIASAASYLPLSESAAIPKKYGTRHRAAIGLSEETDAITIVVSEETGDISIAHRSNLMPELSVEQMQNYLTEHLQPETEEKETTAFAEHINNITDMIRKVMRGD
ncbi:diadenylate cyclase [Atopostipes suicloacalis DSM 15692]|uniref:Diadenylate cyclase n=1 Tax=Atopostipes suicloacalis DSM 15692 TaxID=1121025 RepID=A0A1M4WS91_9LACT|nr:diadenylate cyclase CdaA [Atopostipes suicloacalis]SHE83913.1 diadenylate cyclase [Atopostipes suicloacalis DSM 15692]